MISDSKCNNISRRCTWASSCATTETSVCRFGETNKFAGIRMDGHVRPQVNGPHSEVADGVEVHLHFAAQGRLVGVARLFDDLARRLRGLMKSLVEFPDMVESCASSYEPHRLAEYLHELAGLFHKFYHVHRVVTEDKRLTVARIALCLATRTVLANGFAILGISAPEKM